MPKTDKELTIEVIVALMQSWSGEGKTPISSKDLPNIIVDIYNTIHKLTE